jgi:hypothetical protein
MPTLYIIFNDMSFLDRFFSKSRFKLSFMSIHSIYVGIFYPSGEQSDDLFIRSMSSRAKRGDLMPLRKGMGLPLLLLSLQRRLQQPQLVNNPG